MRRIFNTLALVAGLGLAACTTTADDTAPVSLADRPAAAVNADDAVEQLLARVDIPHETFTLDNGLRVVVHEDR